MIILKGKRMNKNFGLIICTRKGIKLLSILTFILLIIMPWTGMAQDFPERPINFWVQTAPGGPVDLTARALADIATELLGKRVLVVNKPGGAGSVMLGELAKEKPDGYTFAGVGLGALTLVPQQRNVSYDGLSDFEYIMLYRSMPGGILCRADKPWKTMKELLTYSRQNPGKIMYGTPGKGGPSHIGAEYIVKKEGIKWRMIPYGGSNPLVSALLGGNIDLAIHDITLYPGHVKSGEVRVLAVDEVAKEIYPEAATFEELGYILSVGGTGGMVAPKGTPANIVKKLHDTFKRAMEDPRYELVSSKLGVFRKYASSEDFSKMVRTQYEIYGSILGELGLIKTE